MTSMTGHYDYAAFIDAGPHCSGCGEIPPACCCSACDKCGEHALERDLFEQPGGDMLCAGCDTDRQEAAYEAEQERLMSEPPMSAAERHKQAWQDKQEARGR